MQWCSLKCMCALRAGTRASGAEPQRLISDLPAALSTTAAAPLASPPLELITTDQYRPLRLCSASCPSCSQQKFSLSCCFFFPTSPKTWHFHYPSLFAFSSSHCRPHSPLVPTWFQKQTFSPFTSIYLFLSQTDRTKINRQTGRRTDIQIEDSLTDG